MSGQKNEWDNMSKWDEQRMTQELSASHAEAAHLRARVEEFELAYGLIDLEKEHLRLCVEETEVLLAAARARVEELERELSVMRDIPLSRLQFPDGTVPAGTVECAEGWHREAMRFWADRDGWKRLWAEAQDSCKRIASDLDAARARLALVEGDYANVMARYNSDAQIILKVGRLMRLIDTNGLRGLPNWLRDALGSLVETAHDVMDRRPAAQHDEGVKDA